MRLQLHRRIFVVFIADDYKGFDTILITRAGVRDIRGHATLADHEVKHPTCALSVIIRSIIAFFQSITALNGGSPLIPRL